MPSMQAEHREHCRLRFVYDDTVVSYDLAVDATFGEIAQKLRELLYDRYSTPVAIDVTMWSRRPEGTVVSFAR